MHPAIHDPTGTEAYPGSQAWVSGLPGEELDVGDSTRAAGGPVGHADVPTVRVGHSFDYRESEA